MFLERLDEYVSLQKEAEILPCPRFGHEAALSLIVNGCFLLKPFEFSHGFFVDSSLNHLTQQGGN